MLKKFSDPYSAESKWEQERRDWATDLLILRNESVMKAVTAAQPVAQQHEVRLDPGNVSAWLNKVPGRLAAARQLALLDYLGFNNDRLDPNRIHRWVPPNPSKQPGVLLDMLARLMPDTHYDVYRVNLTENQLRGFLIYAPQQDTLIWMRQTSPHQRMFTEEELRIKDAKVLTLTPDILEQLENPALQVDQALSLLDLQQQPSNQSWQELVAWLKQNNVTPEQVRYCLKAILPASS